MHVTCKKCGSILNVPQEMKGTLVECGDCKNRFVAEYDDTSLVHSNLRFKHYAVASIFVLVPVSVGAIIYVLFVRGVVGMLIVFGLVAAGLRLSQTYLNMKADGHTPSLAELFRCFFGSTGRT